jgi:hypothetical protein
MSHDPISYFNKNIYISIRGVQTDQFKILIFMDQISFYIENSKFINAL